MFTKNKFHLGAVTLTAAFAVTLALGTSAQAVEAGEENTIHPEISGGQQIYAPRGAFQARGGPTLGPTNLVEIWVDNSGRINLAIDNRAGVTWPSGNTWVAPRVIYTRYGWRAFHTGIDGFVYYAGFEINQSTGAVAFGNWTQVPGNVRTWHPVGVTAIYGDTPAEEWMLTWRGEDSNQIYSQYHLRNESVNRFDPPRAIEGARSPYSPGMSRVLRTWTEALIVAWTGEDGNVYTATQYYGTSVWNSNGRIAPLSNANATGAPSIDFDWQDVDNYRAGQIAIRTSGYSGGTRMAQVGLNLENRTFADGWGWSDESTHTSTASDPQVTFNNHTAYLILHDGNHNLWWKASGRYQ